MTTYKVEISKYHLKEVIEQLTGLLEYIDGVAKVPRAFNQETRAVKDFLALQTALDILNEKLEELD